MSNPSDVSENAAPDAPVSLASPGSPCRAAGSSASATPTPTPTHPRPDAPPSPPTSTTTIPTGTWPQDLPIIPTVAAVVAVAPGQYGPVSNSAVPSTSTTTATSVPSLPQQASTSSSPGDQIKYHRGPAVLTRPHGPSLLTQALATARGIHSLSATAKAPAAITHPSQDRSSATDPSSFSSPSSSSAEPQLFPSRAVGEQSDPYNAASALNDGDSLTPQGSARVIGKMPSSTAVATAVAHTYGLSESSSKQYNVLDLGEVNSMLNGHREFLSKGKERGTSPERTERERRPQDRTSRAGVSHHVSANGNMLPGPPLTESPSALPGSGSEAGYFPETSQDLRARKLEHRVSMGPEKAWSISAGEAIGCEDGQVEKSITEAIAGAEPNARASRKASHSLRFFKEGNPDDKGKKRDPRHGTTQQRDKLPPMAEATEDERAKEGASVWIPPASGETALNADGSTRPCPIPLQALESHPVTVSPEDYGLQPGSKVHNQGAEAVKPLSEPSAAALACQVPDPEEVASDSALDSAFETCQKLDVADGISEVGEEGDESGEEKISSALFLPHQGPEQSEEEVPLARVPPRTVPSSRTLSRTDDFHPWLVKAGEPEVDAKLERTEYERKQRPEPAEPPIVAPEVDFSHVDGSAIADESEPSILPKPSRPVSQYQEEYIHDHQWTPRQPLEAIELIPYKHQVGGHTTLWRFSRRAVCKQLNNRENEFYEKIEKYHRDLLPFLPRYIGVLNVTFQKKPRRKSTLRREDAAGLERKMAQLEAESEVMTNKTAGDKGTQGHRDTQEAAGHQRVISQSLQAPQGAVPTVTFVDNQHILPRNLLQPPQSPTSSGRVRGASASVQGPGLNGHTSPGVFGQDLATRPQLSEYHANSWGATTVNKKLRNEVFNDAFLKRPIAVRRHRKGHQRAAPRRSLQQVLRPTGSDPSLATSLMTSHEGGVRDDQTSTGVKEQAIPQPHRRLAQTQSEVGQQAACSDDDEAPKDVTGTSAPEPEILADSPAQKKKRRYSGTGLRRKPKEVTDARGDLKYFEEADDVGYKGGKGKPLESTAPSEHDERPRTPQDQGVQVDPQGGLLFGFPLSAASELPSPTAEFKKIPRPVNPKEAQTQSDSRVEYFLLLEDLTAGMKRPCIMDLKMGTRQYGVEANPKKQKSQQGKCAKTTSRELGVRVCGLQVWDVKTQGYVFKDKYYGRDLKQGQEFQGALTRFLYDGVDRASILRHIPTVLQKLDQLEVIISRLRGYRFYAASLLMFYDGDTSDDYDTAIEDSTTDFATDTEDAPRRSRKNPREIDFKMADFANCVTAGDLSQDKPCPPKHPDEPDRGFLRGLRSLRKYFLKIQRDTRVEMGLIAGQVRVLNGELDAGVIEEGSVSE